MTLSDILIVLRSKQIRKVPIDPCEQWIIDNLQVGWPCSYPQPVIQEGRKPEDHDYISIEGLGAWSEEEAIGMATGLLKKVERS